MKERVGQEHRLPGVRRLEDHGGEGCRVAAFDRFAVCDEFVDHRHFAADDPKERVAPERDQDDAHAEFVVGVLLMDMDHFVLQYLLSCRGFQTDVFMPEDITEERKRRPFLPCVHETECSDGVLFMLLQELSDAQQADGQCGQEKDGYECVGQGCPLLCREMDHR